jgi:hypothetical protein
MSWRAWPFGKRPAAPDAPPAEIEKQGKQYLDEADNGKWVYADAWYCAEVNPSPSSRSFHERPI